MNLSNWWRSLRKPDSPRAPGRRARRWPEHLIPTLEHLEDRLAPSTTTTFVDDNWADLTRSSGAPMIGDVIQNTNDTINHGGVTAVYGMTGFGTVLVGATPGTAPGAATINDAIANTTAGGTVNVLEGTYNELVTVNKPVTLLGANNANPGPGRSGPESIIEPGLMSDFNTSSVVTVQADNVTIEGFTIQGSIASPPAGQSPGFTLTSGTTVYAAAGVSNSSNINTAGPGAGSSTTDVAGLTVQNNIIQDFTQVGVYGDTSDAAVSTGNTIANNVIRDVPNNGQGGFIGEGVIIYDNFYADVTGNQVSAVRTGIQTGNNNLSAGAFAPSISNNTVSAYVKGIYYNLQYQSASPFTISNNTITQADPTVSPVYNVGLLIQSIQTSVQSVIQGNNVSGFLYGVEFAGNNTTNTVTLQGGTLSNNGYGVWDTNNDYFYPANYDTTAALSDVTITNSTIAGIWIDSTSPNSANQSNTTNTASLAIGGGTRVAGGPVGLLVAGAESQITGGTLNDTTFTGQSNQYIDLIHGALSGSVIDATGVSFDGVTGGAATPAQNFAIEDKVFHAVDDATVGFVRVKAANVFVTPASGSIQRGIDAATTGDTVNVAAGTYAEKVTVNKTVAVMGAQHGVSAVMGRPGAQESILDASGDNGATPFNVTANDVTIDGFTIENATSANAFGFGILLGAGTSGSHVLNNIIQNNIAGLSLANHSSTDGAVIQGNLFQNNNQPGPVSGTAIYTDQFNAGGVLTNVLIDGNAFVNDQNAGVLLGSTQAGSQTDITISNNTFTGDGNAVFVGDATQVAVYRNTITGSTASQIVAAGGVTDLAVTQNFIDNGATNGVRILIDSADGFAGANQDFTIGANHIQGNAAAGINLDAGAYTGTLSAGNNWWGSSTGPTTAASPGGTSDKIIDPDNVVVFVPFLTTGTDAQPGTPGFMPSPNPPPPPPPPPAPGLTPPPSVSVAFGPFGQVTEMVTSAGQLVQFDAAGAHTLGGGVRAASVAFFGGSEVLLVTYQNGGLAQFDAAGAHLLAAAGVLDASAAFGPAGEVLDVVSAAGVLTQFDAAGAHTLGGGVATVSVVFGPTGEVQLVTTQNGTLTQLDATGAHTLAAGVRSAGGAFGPTGEVVDVIFQDGSLWQSGAGGAVRLGMVP